MTTRAIVLAVVLSLVGILWIHQASLVQAPGNPYAPVYFLSVPPVPAVVFLFLLSAGAGLLQRWRRTRPLATRELMVIYIVLVVAVPPTTFGIVETLLPWATAPTYFGTPQDGLDEIAGQYFPSWVAPQDRETIQNMFEGSETGAIPWGQWWRPLGGWLLFTSLVFGTTLCLLALFHRQWSDNEHLRYPLLLLPLSVAGKESRHAEVSGVLRNPLTWIAVGLVLVHHAMNVAHAYNPAVMALGDRYRLGDIFTERPWTAFRPLTFMHRPQMIGFSYFVSVDVLLSGWFFFVVQYFVQMMSDIAGYRGPSGFPFAPQQGCGAFTASFLALIWVGRGHLKGLVQSALGTLRGEVHEREPMTPALALGGALLGFGALVVWCMAMGLSPWLAASYFGLLLGWSVVYARIRAEAGLATMWAFPFDQHPEVIKSVLGTRALIKGSDASQLVLIGLMSWFSRGYFQSLSGYVAENHKLADETNLPARRLPALIMLAFVVGMVGGYFVTLKSYYGLGANVLHGGTSSGGYNVRGAMNVWNGVSTAVRTPSGPDTPRVIGMVAGAVISVLLVAARRQWLRFPFHPLGYAMALNYGYALWGPFVITWLLKIIIDRLGGAQLYRKLMPFFLGLAIGDLMAGGLMWLIMGLFGGDITNGYVVQFG
jgi:hypothetical protein